MRKRPTALERKATHIVWLPKRRELRVKRAEVGLKVYQIAKDLGRSLSHVSDVMNGRRTSGHLARDIADYFEVPIEDLFVRADLENPD
jgi:hypothetical protein